MLPFSGYRVIEIGHRVGSGFCGKLLSDFGAEVVLIERPEGHPMRARRSFSDGDTGGLFAYLHAGKQSAVVGDDMTDLRELVESADVLVFGASNNPDPEERILFDQLKDSNAGLITVHISPYGISGPYAELPGTEFTAAALSGITQRIGRPDRSPLTIPLAQAGYQAGYAGASGAACALMARKYLSRGQLVEVSETEVLATVHVGYAVTRFQRAGVVEHRAGHRIASLPYPQTVLPCADGFVSLNTPEGRQWGRLLEMMGSPEWGKNERYRSRGRNSKPPLVDELDSYFKEWLKGYTKEQFYALCRKFEVPSGPVRTIDEVFQDEQLESRGFFNSITLPDGRMARAPGSGCALSRTPALRDRVVPRLGQCANPAIDRKKSARVPAATAVGSEDVRGPLHGLRILDLGWVWAGAIPGQLLADMGAVVIKVESTKRIDYMRLGAALVDAGPAYEQNPWFHAVNRNKKSITVNLQSEKGVELLKKLASRCDAVIENFKPGFLSKIGMDFASLSPDNPRLVMLSMSGVGQTGPSSQGPAYAPFLSGLSGLDSLVGYPGEEILGIQQPYADTNAGVTGAFGLIAALLHQQRTGQGQHIDLAESEAAIAVIGEAFVAHSLTQMVPKPQGNDRPDFAPHGHYPTAGDDKWFALAVESQSQWESLCRVLGEQGLADCPLFATADARWLNRRQLDDAISQRTRSMERARLVSDLQRMKVPAMPLLSAEEILEDAQYCARDAFVGIEHPILGMEKVFGPMWRMSLSVHDDWRHAPLMGEHTSEVMSELIGMSPDEIEKLVELEVLV